MGNIKKEVQNKLKQMIDGELSSAQLKLRINKLKINELAEEQRILKASIGELYKLKKGLS